MDYTLDHIDNEFLDSFKSEDDIGVVIRSHIFIEKQLMAYNRKFVKHPDYLEYATPFYNHIVNLSLAFGLSPTFQGPLKKIGKIRNHFGHDQNATLDKKLVDEFYASFSGSIRKSVLDVLRNDKDFSASRLSGNLHDWPPKQKCTFLVTILHAYIKLAIANGSGEIEPD